MKNLKADTSRLEEFEIVPTADTEASSEYAVTLPAGIVTVHDAGSYLEFFDVRGVPVVRFHYSVAMDSLGEARNGKVALKGVGEADEKGRRLILGDSLRIATHVDLGGLTPPIVIDPGWSSTGSMAVPRILHSATLLPSGKVLVAGGHDGVNAAFRSAELYDPPSESWSSTASMSFGRYLHGAVLLPTGEVLVMAGGHYPLMATELYDPVTSVWSRTGNLQVARQDHSATLLASGKVVVAGGLNPFGTTDSVEVYERSTGTWTQVAHLTKPRRSHSAVLLASGQVLIAGGVTAWYDSSSELLDPTTMSWLPTGAMLNPRVDFTLTLLPSGRVLAAGGLSPYVERSAEVYDPSTGVWTSTGSMSFGRQWLSATLLTSGRVLVAGGRSEGGSILASSEIYDPAAGAWTMAGSMTFRRFSHPAVLLLTGKVLVAGGYYGSSYPLLASAELFDEGFVPPSNQPPTASAGADILAECVSSGGALIALDGSASSDPDSSPGTNDDIVTFEWFEGTTLVATGETASATMSLGSHAITLKVTDSDGLSDTDDVLVTVSDTTAPTLSVSVSPSSLWPPNHKMVPITAAFSVSDVCDASPAVVLGSATSNEPDNGLGDGDTENDIQTAGGLQLRAERSGTGTGRIYTLTYQATDSSGNSTTATATVTVPHDQGEGQGQG
ncbi:MAG: hypothetical protein HYT87_04295 [Nitrospirae bacterium]|nr:hypothetical protein [Nitrospirota bacterium]